MAPRVKGHASKTIPMYKLQCACGWESSASSKLKDARSEHAAHRTSVAPTTVGTVGAEAVQPASNTELAGGVKVGQVGRKAPSRNSGSKRSGGSNSKRSSRKR
jgi:hypothetical protein